MKRRLAGKQTGFTLIVVAIIGILAAILIPNMLDALQKAKQKRTVAEMRITGTAMFAWLSDQVGAAAAGQSATSIDLTSYAETNMTGIRKLLVPLYIENIPDVDGWKKPFVYYLDPSTVQKRNVMAIFSGGRDLSSPTGTYTVSNFDPTDYDQDVIWADGFFVRWPQK